jgi:hypothetical protein
MENSLIWLLKILISHLITDFVLQPADWIEDRRRKHFGSGFLYLHGLVTAGLVYLLIGGTYWVVVLVIGGTHILIDGWKSYQKTSLRYFLADQFMHVLVLGACYYFTFLKTSDLFESWNRLAGNLHFWKLSLGLVFLTLPAGILIGLMTRQWRERIQDINPESLYNAGKWIGIIERIIVLILVLHDQYGAIGLLVAAKSIVRFNEKERQEIKTEYLMIGTLLSIGIAIITGVIIK